MIAIMQMKPTMVSDMIAPVVNLYGKK